MLKIKFFFVLSASFVLTNAFASVDVVDSKGTCRELAIGSERIVSISQMMSSTRVEQYFTLKRVDSDSYELYINYDFKLQKNYKTDGASSLQVFGNYKKRIQECFDQHQDLLKDEKGRSLRLYVYNEKRDLKITRPKAVSINLLWATNEKFRANSRNYNHEITCETLIHEGLHLTGLVDEYEETQMKTMILKKPKYNRRALGPESSIMRAPWEIENPSVDHVLFSGQINAILYPNCASKNSKYYTCASLAYKTGKKEVPEYCTSEDWVKENN
jgi:hypothetical protein